MSLRRTWQLKDYVHDVIRMLEQETPWFKRGNKLLIMLTNNLPLCPFCREQKLQIWGELWERKGGCGWWKCGRNTRQERLEGRHESRDCMAGDVRSFPVCIQQLRGLQITFLFPLTFFWREAVAPTLSGTMCWLGDMGSLPCSGRFLGLEQCCVWGDLGEGSHLETSVLLPCLEWAPWGFVSPPGSILLYVKLNCRSDLSNHLWDASLGPSSADRFTLDFALHLPNWVLRGGWCTNAARLSCVLSCRIFSTLCCLPHVALAFKGSRLRVSQRCHVALGLPWMTVTHLSILVKIRILSYCGWRETEEKPQPAVDKCSLRPADHLGSSQEPVTCRAMKI